MDVVALVSGGKDSCFAMMECQEVGHRIACLAHVSVASAHGADADSFMFQSAATEAVSAVAAAMELPLLVEESRGLALRQELHYAAPATTEAEGDEVEALLVLLQRVMQAYPQVRGVCSGAILSTYQRTRIESVCERLGLVSLSFLWQRRQEEVLDAMLAAGMEAVLVKTAGVGLEPRKHLGRSVAELRPHFGELHELYDFHVAGEGGEYETFTLDCPLFRHKIVLDETEVLETGESGTLRILAYHLEPKEEAAGAEEEAAPGSVEKEEAAREAADAEAPDAAPEKPRGADREASQAGMAEGASSDGPASLGVARIAAAAAALLPLVHRDGAHAYVDGVRGRNALAWAAAFPHLVKAVWPPGLSSLDALSNDIERQMGAALAMLSVALERQGLARADVTYVHLGLRDMQDFATGNAVYCRFFGQQPPSRSCVELPLGSADRVCLDASALQGSHAAMLSGDFGWRQVLHVQSLSHWAPTCIGPYSQAQALGRHFYCLAGQIGLVPATMALPTPTSPEKELGLCLRHCAAILDTLPEGGAALRHALQGILWVSAPACLPQADEAQRFTVLRDLVAMARAAGSPRGSNAGYPRESLETKQAKAEARRAKAMAAFGQRKGAMFLPEPDASSEEEAAGEDAGPQVPWPAPLAVAVVSGLPKGCAVEVEILALSEVAFSRYEPEAREERTQEAVEGRRRGRTEPGPSWPPMAPAISVNADPADRESFVEVASAMQVVPGVCCAGHVAVARVQGPAAPAPGDGPSLEALVRCAHTRLLRCLGESGLALGNVHHLRAFLPLPEGAVGLVVGRLLDRVREAFVAAMAAASPEERPAVTVVPCVEVFDSQGPCELLVQLTAHDLRRLEADMWVHDGGHV